jgi:hypothetical protein
MKVVVVRNVNEALDDLRRELGTSIMVADPLLQEFEWVVRPSRNGRVLEVNSPVATVYCNPSERVSFGHARDANPFFHLFEALWILAGRSDVRFLNLFNKRMVEYSDDGETFHAPYGKRLRNHWIKQSAVSGGRVKFEVIDQIRECARMLREDPDTRRAVMMIWDPSYDLGTHSKDIPCNDTVFFKSREGRLDMTVCCRSNDAIWGAYGTNVVQFSTIMELVAGSAGLAVGRYTQISDSLHVYIDNPAWQRMLSSYDWRADLYARNEVRCVPMWVPGRDKEAHLEEWFEHCERFCEDILTEPFIPIERYHIPFFHEVAIPMWRAWWEYKNRGLTAAVEFLDHQDLEIDWLAAAMRWLTRRSR